MRNKLGRTQCKYGHPYTQESARFNSRGSIVCRICQRRIQRAKRNSVLTCDYATSGQEYTEAIRATLRQRPLPTHCRNGHEYTEENTAKHNDARRCKICAAKRKEEYKDQSSAAARARNIVNERRKALNELINKK